MYSKSIVGARVALFLGAGASQPFGKLLMGEFVYQTPQAMGPGSNKLWDILKKHQANHDLENLLQQIDELRTKDKELWPDSNQFGAGQLPKSNLDLVAVALGLQSIPDMAEGLGKSIRRAIYSSYGEISDRGKVVKVFTPIFDTLIRRMAELSKPLIIFTTNYDPAVEIYSEECLPDHPLVDGFQYDNRNRRGPVWDRRHFDDFSLASNEPRIVLFKLHGSARWYDLDGRLVQLPFSHFASDETPYQNLLIYPAKNKVALKDPFFTAYDYLQRVLDECRLLICIGYSFRDYDALSKLKSCSLHNQNLNVLVIDPHAEKLSKQLQEDGVRAIPLIAKLGEDLQFLGKVWEEVEKAVREPAEQTKTSSV
jgi:hypothetical protein